MPRDTSKFCTHYSLISHHLFSKYPLQHNGLVSYQTPKILALFQGDLRNPDWPLISTSKQFQTDSRRNSQNAGLATNRYLKILDPSQGEELHKTWYGFFQYPKYRSHSWETSMNDSNFHYFSKHQTHPSDLTTDPKVYELSPDNIS